MACQVVTHVLGSLNFSRSHLANLVPLARGLLYFSLSAPYDLYLYNSRIGATPAYSTVYRAMENLASDEAATLKAHGCNPVKFGIVILDNVQTYHLQRDSRIGRENTIKIGVAATYVELPDVDPAAFDLRDKLRRVAESRRKDLTVEDLLGLLDQQHIETVGILQWLRVLTTHIPELSKYGEHVSLLYRTRAAKHMGLAVVHP